jgi:DnaJ-related protein SCJ1
MQFHFGPGGFTQQTFTHTFNINNQAQITKNLYKVLEIKESATIIEINKQYKRLAFVHHPDKNAGSDVEFKKISQAKEILTDPKQREIYDKYGDAGLDKIQQLKDEYEQLEKRKDAIKATEYAKIIPLVLSLSDYYKGVSLTKTIKRTNICTMCSGYGKLNINLVTCEQCLGQGVSMQRNLFGMMFNGMNDCNRCKGTGKYVDLTKNYDVCKTCNGEGKLNEDYDIKIDIPVGIGPKGNTNNIGEKDVKNINIIDVNIKISENEGDEYEIGKRGIVIAALSRESNQQLDWINNDLFLSLNISLEEALCGLKRTFVHPNGNTYLFKTLCGSQVINYEIMKEIQGLGMPQMKRNSKNEVVYGCLNIGFNIEFPKTVTNTYLKKLQKIFRTNSMNSETEKNNKVSEVIEINIFDAHKQSEEDDDHAPAIDSNNEQQQQSCRSQ